MKKAFDTFRAQPRNLFLIDGMGALLSAFLLGVVLVAWESAFGIPARVLYVLAVFPVLFAAYDFWAFRTVKASVSRALRGIALMNGSYCALSIILTWTHRTTVTPLGWAYIVGEIALVVALAAVEWRIAAHHETTLHL